MASCDVSCANDTQLYQRERSFGGSLGVGGGKSTSIWCVACPTGVPTSRVWSDLQEQTGRRKEVEVGQLCLEKHHGLS